MNIWYFLSVITKNINKMTGRLYSLKMSTQKNLKTLDWQIPFQFISQWRTTIMSDHKCSAMPLRRSQFSPKSSQQTPHSFPMRARHGVHFVSINLTLCSAAAAAELYVRSCYTRTCVTAVDCTLHRIPARMHSEQRWLHREFYHT